MKRLGSTAPGTSGSSGRVLLPLCRPVLAVCVVFVFLGTWNDLLGPLIYLDHNSEFTVAIGLANLVTRLRH